MLHPPIKCHWTAADTLTFIEYGTQMAHVRVHIGRTGRSEDIALTLVTALRLREQLDEFLGDVQGAVAATPEPTPEPTPPSYTALSPLCKTIYQHMNRAGSISARDAFDDYGITSASLARRICDIEAEGYKVKRDRRVHPVTDQRYTRYSLAA